MADRRRITSVGSSGIATKSGHVNTENDFCEDHRIHSFALALISGEERHADPVAANCSVWRLLRVQTFERFRFRDPAQAIQAAPAGGGAGLPCFCKLDPRSGIPRVAFLRLFHEKAQSLTKLFDKSGFWVYKLFL